MQIDVPETLSIEGRADFYEKTGAYRDMVVTHLFQVLGFVAMEPPTAFTARQLRSEKLKVFDALKPIDVRHVVRGQYEGYRSEPGVAPDSQTETMVALRVEVDNWRWHGVPFYLRSGKCLGAGRQVITLGFHEPPLRMFAAHRKDIPDGRRNEIIIDFADPGSITTKFLAKEPGAEMSLGSEKMIFKYADSFANANALEGYERLILDAYARRPVTIHQLRGNPATLGDFRAAAEQRAAGRAIRAGLMGPGFGQQADRALQLASAGRNLTAVPASFLGNAADLQGGARGTRVRQAAVPDGLRSPRFV